VKQEHINEWWGAIHAAPEWEVQPQFEERNLFAQVEAVKWANNNGVKLDEL